MIIHAYSGYRVSEDVTDDFKAQHWVYPEISKNNQGSR